MREEKESKIALISMITSTLKIECGLKLIALKIFRKNPGLILDIKEKYDNFEVCLPGFQFSRTMLYPSPLSKIRNDPEFFSTWGHHF